MKSYSIYFYSPSGHCILRLDIDGRSKARALKMGRSIARLITNYYQQEDIPWGRKITAKVEDYITGSQIDYSKK